MSCNEFQQSTEVKGPILIYLVPNHCVVTLFSSFFLGLPFFFEGGVIVVFSISFVLSIKNSFKITERGKVQWQGAVVWWKVHGGRLRPLL